MDIKIILSFALASSATMITLLHTFSCAFSAYLQNKFLELKLLGQRVN